MENVEEEILRLHHTLLEDIKNPHRQADCHRKSIAHLLKASFKNLSNENTSALLENKLKTYSNIAHNTQENVYDDKLKSVLSKAKNITGNNFKSNLSTINAKQFIKPLPCCSKTYCVQSENIGEAEFDELQEIFKNLKRSPPTTTNVPQTDTKMVPKQPESTLLSSNKTSLKRTHKDKESSGTGVFNNCFKTAREELEVQSLKNKYGNVQQSSGDESCAVLQKRGPSKLGTRRNVGGKFIPPIKSNSGSNEDIKSETPLIEVDERLKNIEPKMVELIKSEIMNSSTSLHWNDIAGLAFAKTAIQEAVVWPMLRPDIFTGLRRPPKGILLFGPPGTGKTLIGKCVASQSKSTFFSISASSLTSKWVGDGEKMVRALFAVARVHQPSVIFIDEVDSLLSQRSDTEHESSRRIKTEFLVQLDGATTDTEERLLIIGATNRPQELDEAARRRFVKRLYIPLPEYEARLQLVQQLICNENHRLEDEDFEKIASLSDGFSGADIKNLCSEASLGPIRSIDFNLIEHIQASDVRPLLMEDFEKALTRVKSSVAPKDLEQYIAWDKIYGSGF